ERRAAQRALATHMTDRLHGESERVRVETASSLLFEGGALDAIDERTLREMAEELPSSEHPATLLSGDGVPLSELLAATSLASSRREAREFVAKGAISLNGRRVGKECRITEQDLLPGGLLFLRRGKRSWHVAKWVRG